MQVSTNTYERDVVYKRQWFEEGALLVGGTARPSLPESRNRFALAVEDAITFVKLFSHLEQSNEADFFLRAFQEVREKRYRLVDACDQAFLTFLTAGEHSLLQKPHDALLQLRAAAKQPVFHVSDRDAEQLILHDAEVEAEKWWAEWGTL
ncbi:hypothetical protein MPER_01545, partial [Moniliophthora perniciosa FA553]